MNLVSLNSLFCKHSWSALLGLCTKWNMHTNLAHQCVSLSANRFSMAWENGIQMPFTFFVFAWHWKTDLNFAFCFSFSPNFEKWFWTSYFVFRFRITLKNGYQFQFSFFVFASLWKTDLNFVLRFCIACYWKTDWSFVCRFCMNLKSGYVHQSFETPPTPSPRGWPG